MACARISATESVYPWDGAVQQNVEWRIVFKTQRNLYAQMQSAIQALHSYDLPAIHAVALKAIEPTYGDWVDSHGKPAQPTATGAAHPPPQGA